MVEHEQDDGPGGPSSYTLNLQGGSARLDIAVAAPLVEGKIVTMQYIDDAALEQLGELIGGDPALLAELVETFIDEGGEIVGALQTSILTEDLDALRLGAHSLKSSAQDFGASELAALSGTLESRAKSAWPASAKVEVAAIASAFEDARQDLATWLASGGL